MHHLQPSSSNKIVPDADFTAAAIFSWLAWFQVASASAFNPSLLQPFFPSWPRSGLQGPPRIFILQLKQSSLYSIFNPSSTGLDDFSVLESLKCISKVIKIIIMLASVQLLARYFFALTLNEKSH